MAAGHCYTQVGAPSALWAGTITFISEVRKQTKRTVDNTMVGPLLQELRENDDTVEILPEQDGVEFWPSWGETTKSPQSRSWVASLATVIVS